MRVYGTDGAGACDIDVTLATLYRVLASDLNTMTIVKHEASFGGFIIAIVTSVLLVLGTLPAWSTGDTVRHMSWQGHVYLDDVRTPIPGASIRVVGTRRGVYSGADGAFHLVLPDGTHRIAVRSVGCHDDTVTITPGQRNVDIVLRSAPRHTSSVTVTGAIQATEVIRRAIARKDSNAAKVRTLVTDLYTRQTITSATTVFGKIDTTPRVTERLATMYEAFVPTRRQRLDIHQRRQSNNVRAEENVVFTHGFDDIRRDSVEVADLIIYSPLATSALDRYRYTLVDKLLYGDRYIYVVDFEPQSRLGPAFEGRMHILEGSYDVVATSYRVTDETAIPYIDSAHLHQRYEELEPGIWLPVAFTARARASVTALFGFVDLGLDFVITMDATGQRINQPLGDSIFTPPPSGGGGNGVGAVSTLREGQWAQRRNSLVRVDDGADSLRPEQWDSLTVTRLSDEERRLLAIANTLSPRRQRPEATADDNAVEPFSLFSFRLGPARMSVTPRLGRTSITGTFYGAGMTARVDSASVGVEAVFGKPRQPFGRLGLGWSFAIADSATLSVRGGVLSAIRTIQNEPPSVTAAINTGNLLFGLQRDYYRADGYHLGASYRNGRFGVSLDHEGLHHIAMPRVEQVDRPELPVVQGRYLLGHLRLSLVETSPLALINGYQTSPFGGSIGLTAGQGPDGGTTFGVAHATISTRLNTFSTGYQPMHLRISLRGEVATSDAPPQYLFYSTPRFVFTGDYADLLTTPLNGYGGDRHYQVVAEHNCSDYLWRALGLPLIYRRGLDLIVSYGAARFEQHAAYPVRNVTRPTDGWYQEAGFGIDRIPTFLMEHLNLRVDMRWPVGHLRGEGSSFGWCVGITSPLF